MKKLFGVKDFAHRSCILQNEDVVDADYSYYMEISPCLYVGWKYKTFRNKTEIIRQLLSSPWT